MRFFPDQADFNAQVNGLVSLDLVRKDGSNLVLTERRKIALRTWTNRAVSVGDKSPYHSFTRIVSENLKLTIIDVRIAGVGSDRRSQLVRSRVNSLDVV